MQGLNSLFQSDPLAQEVGLTQMLQERQRANLDIDRTRQSMGHEAQMNPLRLEQQRLSNQTSQAQLPGIQAQSGLQQSNLEMKLKTFNSDLEKQLSENRSKITKNDLDELTNTGNAYLQAGELLEKLPGGARKGAARQILKQYYRDEFDQVPENILGNVLRYVGQGMTDAQVKFSQGMQKQNDQQAFIEAENRRKEEAAASLQKTRLEQAATLAKAKDDAKKSNTKESYENLATSMERAAMAETDPERKAFYQEQASFYRDSAKFLKPPMPQAPVVDPTQLPPGTPLKAPEAQAAPPRPGATKTIEQVLKEQGKSYEPDKYEYRIDPATGKVQRKAKG